MPQQNENTEQEQTKKQLLEIKSGFEEMVREIQTLPVEVKQGLYPHLDSFGEIIIKLFEKYGVDIYDFRK